MGDCLSNAVHVDCGRRRVKREEGRGKNEEGRVKREEGRVKLVLILVLDVSWVVFEDVFSQRSVVKVGVHLCSADVGVAQEVLNDAQVGSSA